MLDDVEDDMEEVVDILGMLTAFNIIPSQGQEPRDLEKSETVHDRTVDVEGPIISALNLAF